MKIKPDWDYVDWIVLFMGLGLTSILFALAFGIVWGVVTS